jgi:ribose transport system ATP-binding protein
METLAIRAASPRQPMATVSGGNQQKAVLARWLSRRPSLLLLDEPTQGVDVSARAEIHSIVRESAAAGCAVIVTSGDFRELVALCDRVLVMTAGRFVDEVGRGATPARLAMLALATHDG